MDGAALFCPGSDFRSVLSHDKFPDGPGARDGGRRVLVRVREHLFLSGGAPGRRARRGAGRQPRWRPFLLGPIFAAQGWRDLPFNIYPDKGRYMWRDLERTCAAMGVPFCAPSPFPQPSLLAARVALALEDEERANFSRRVYVAEFGRGFDRRSGHTHVLARRLWRRSRGHARAGRKRGQQGGSQSRVRPGGEIGIVGAPSSSPRMGRSSGAMIGSNRGSIGRRERATERRSTVVPDVRRQRGE